MSKSIGKTVVDETVVGKPLKAGKQDLRVNVSAIGNIADDASSGIPLNPSILR